MAESRDDGRDGRFDPIAARHEDVLAAIIDRGQIRVTELAAELGVSAVTVRRTVSELSAAGQVRRVHGGAEALPRARSTGDPGRRITAGMPVVQLAGKTAGVMVPSLDYYWPRFVRAVQENLAAADMRMLLRGSSYDATDELRDIRELLSAGSDGLLIAPTMSGEGGDLVRDWLASTTVPTVLVERSAVVGREHVDVESVLTDHAAGASAAVYHLASQGHARIGVACTEISLHADEIRRGWYRAASHLGLPTTGVVDTDIPERRGPGFHVGIEEFVDAVLATGTTAVLVHSDPEAIQVAQSVTGRGLRIPEDLAIVAYDDEIAAYGSPPLTAVQPPRRTIGQAAVNLLAARIADPGRPVHRLTLNPVLRVRESTTYRRAPQT
ncbi:LacI family DNA-binding transcriptional regulator [Sanguibacter antarcticus]|uniref:GntR family transcriptional regulator n=1 Tax=Sanguibacter antarcticus TaxID=372484 RepID=A0A2A9E715_9MICO|nr:substrate-binding domain-containing protein [Sanguibacter antarcticus]PFG34436.1 GntR family transcriptional regulator [Sanguibacter antarcticus]